MLTRLITKPVAVLCVAGLICLLIGRVAQHAYVAAIAAAVVIVLGLVWPWLTIALVSASVRTASRRCRVRERIELDIDVRNRCPLPLPAIALLAATGEHLDLNIPVTTIRSGRQRLSANIAPQRRGIFCLSNLTIGTAFPFGLWQAKRRIDGGGTLIVWPNAERIDVAPLLRGSRILNTETLSARIATEGDLAGVRGYRRGDSLRSIHWQQTARHDRLIVRERAGGEQRGCTVCLDTRRASYADDEMFERAISIVAGIVDSAVADGLTLTIHLTESPVVVSNASVQSAALDVLAGVTWDERPDTPSSWRALRGIFVTTTQGWQSAPARHCSPIFADGVKASGGHL